MSSVVLDEGESGGRGFEGCSVTLGRLKCWEEYGCGLFLLQLNTEQLFALKFIPCMFKCFIKFIVLLFLAVMFFLHILQTIYDSQSPALKDLGTSMLHTYWLNDTNVIYSLAIENLVPNDKSIFLYSVVSKQFGGCHKTIGVRHPALVLPILTRCECSLCFCVLMSPVISNTASLICPADIIVKFLVSCR